MVRAVGPRARRATVVDTLAAVLVHDGLDDLGAGQALRGAEIARLWWERCGEGGLEAGDLLAGIEAFADLPPGQAVNAARDFLDARAVPLPPGRAELLTRYLAHLPPLWRRQLHLGGGKGQPAPAAAEDLRPFLARWAPAFLPGHHPRGVGDLAVEEYLGGGGFGAVYRARYFTLASAPPVVLKFCHAEQGARFLRHEARILDALGSRGGVPGVIQVQATFCEDAEVPALAFPWIDGFTLQDYLEARRRVGRAVAPALVLDLLTRVARILAGLHGCHYVHRDVKPANLLMTAEPGGGHEVYLIDFGIAGPAGQLALDEWELGTVTRQVVKRLLRDGHSRLYASPQQLNGEPSHPNDDVYSAGVVAIQCLSADFAHRVTAYDWAGVLKRRQVSDRFLALLQRCVADQPHRRPADGGELLAELHGL
jgi:tRNA A-37 threonylcarbamoyl transferase component Bud32